MNNIIRNSKLPFLLLFIIKSVCLFGQNDRPTTRVVQKDYPYGASYTQLSRNQTGISNTDFRLLLKSYDFDYARHCFFGVGPYDGSLPDIVCYIDSTNNVYIGLSYDNYNNNRSPTTFKRKGWQNAKPILWGKTKVYVLLISDKKLDDSLITRSGLDTASLINLKDSITKLSTKRSNINPWIASVTTEGNTGVTYSLKISYHFPRVFDSLRVEKILKEVSEKGTLSYLSQNSKIINSIKSISNSFKKRFSSINSGIPSSNDSAGLAQALIKNGINMRYAVRWDSVDFNIVINSKDRLTLKTIQPLLKTALGALYTEKAYKPISIILDSAAGNTFQLCYRIPPFNIRREALQFQPEPGQFSLSNIINAAFSIFSGGKGAIPPSGLPQQLKDSIVSLGKIKILKDGKDLMYATMARFDIAPNSRNRIVIEPSNNSVINSISYAFGNYEKTSIYASLAVGMNIPWVSTKSQGAFKNTLDSNASQPKFYIFANCYLRRPRLPVDPWNVSAMLGTNLSTANPLNDILTGVNVGYDQFSVFVNANYLLFNKDNVRRLIPCVGLNYKFY